MPKRTYRQRLLLASLLVCLALPVIAADIAEQLPRVQSFFPQADRLGGLSADPPVAPVYHGDELVGYVFFTDDIMRIPAYSGKPITTLVGLDLQGRIAGVSIVEHQEPILAVGISNADLERFIGQYLGKSAHTQFKIGGAPRKGYATLDGISGATITVMVLNASISRSVHKIAQSLGLTASSEHLQATPISAAPYQPLWISVWKERKFRILILGIGLFVLLVILTLQDWLARHPTLLIYVRTGYLLYTLVFIGWYALAQLSIVNVLTFTHSITHDFHWENFMIDPMMFILWSFVAVTVLLWGRGVYCGWLCPFGSLQELTFRFARFLRIPSFELPEVVHERLWAIKYIILLVLFAISLQSLGEAQKLVEVEPFKTAITLRFQRESGYVLYALALIILSALNRKFFCRYMCPLGAALTFPGKFRIFDWLRRRKECGRPCQICAAECEVRAIRPTGEINSIECHYCLDCQVTYWNDRKCPPLVDKRRRREKSARLNSPMQNVEVPVPTRGSQLQVCSDGSESTANSRCI